MPNLTELRSELSAAAMYIYVLKSERVCNCTHKDLCELHHVIPGFVRKQQSLKARVYIRQTSKILSWEFGVVVSAFTFSVGKALSPQVRVRDASFRVCSFCISCAISFVYIENVLYAAVT